MGAKLSSSSSSLHKIKRLGQKRSSATPSTASSAVSDNSKSSKYAGNSEQQQQQQQQNNSTDSWALPYATLKTEDARMNANQFALKALFEGNFLPEIGKHVDFESPNTRVLDIGCGAGGWVMDMATEYPATKFVGLDKMQLFPSTIRPVNVEFKQHDVTLGLPFEDNTFDFVHMRLFLMVFTKVEYAACLQEVYRITKPGGFIQLMEVEMMDDGDDFIKEFGMHVDRLMTGNNQDAMIAQKLPSVMSQFGFTPVEEVAKSIPLKGHPLSDEFLYILDISFDTCKVLVKAVYGFSTEEEYLEIKRKWLDSRKNSSNTSWWCAAGRKQIEL